MPVRTPLSWAAAWLSTALLTSIVAPTCSKEAQRSGQSPAPVLVAQQVPASVPAGPNSSSPSSSPLLGAIPPIPPALDPVGDGQPADTIIGNYLVSRLTLTSGKLPATLQGKSVADLCPRLQSWPETIEIDAPNPCWTIPEGFWTEPSSNNKSFGKLPIIRWTQSCTWLTPTIKYRTPKNDLFGLSRTFSVFMGNTAVISDCEGNSRYSVESTVIHEVNRPDTEACEKYQSCDGTIWLQYFVVDHSSGGTVAKTPYLHLFQDKFEIQDEAGTVIATASRVGEWSPIDDDCDLKRKWALTFVPNDGGPFAMPADQWPLAELMTIIANQDARRRPSGLLAPSGCDLMSSTLSVFFSFFTVFILCGGTIAFLRFGVTPAREKLWDLENRVCPSVMTIPSKYDSF